MSTCAICGASDYRMLMRTAEQYIEDVSRLTAALQEAQTELGRALEELVEYRGEIAEVLARCDAGAMHAGNLSRELREAQSRIAQLEELLRLCRPLGASSRSVMAGHSWGDELARRVDAALSASPSFIAEVPE